MNHLPALIGPTGTGKTATLLALRERLPFAVIQADSMQALQRFDIGTAKPTSREREFLPHFCMDVVPPPGQFSAYMFLQEAERVLQEEGGKLPLILSGGTGLYLRAWEEGLSELPPIPEGIRRACRERVQEDPQKVYAFLAEKDPLFAAKVHPRDLRRLSRALEIFTVTNAPPWQYLRRVKRRRITPLRYYGIAGAGEVYEMMLKERILRMLGEGWIEEVKGLIQDYGWELPGFQGVGYREIVQYLKGEIRGEGELVEAIYHHTRGYVRKQRIFFRRLPVRWFPFQKEGVNQELLALLYNELTSRFPGKGG